MLNEYYFVGSFVALFAFATRTRRSTAIIAARYAIAVDARAVV